MYIYIYTYLYVYKNVPYPSVNKHIAMQNMDHFPGKAKDRSHVPQPRLVDGSAPLAVRVCLGTLSGAGWFTLQKSDMAMANPWQLEVRMGKSSINLRSPQLLILVFF